MIVINIPVSLPIQSTNDVSLVSVKSEAISFSAWCLLSCYGLYCLRNGIHDDSYNCNENIIHCLACHYLVMVARVIPLISSHFGP